MKFKVGDKVRVRKDLQRGVPYKMHDSKKYYYAIHDMINFAGKVVTIKAVNDSYRIVEMCCNWTDEMFEGLAEEAPKSPKLKVGQKLRLRKDLREDTYGNISCIYTMAIHAGKIVTVRKIEGNNAFYIEEDLEGCEDGWLWSLEMCEAIEGDVPEEPKPRKLKVGMKVKLRDDLSIDKQYKTLITNSMVNHAGEIVTVRELHPTKKDIFYIEEDLRGCYNHWDWSIDMIEFIDEDPFEDIKLVIDDILIPTKPIVVLPVVTDSFTKAWMESFVKRNGGMAVESK